MVNLINGDYLEVSSEPPPIGGLYVCAGEICFRAGGA